MQLLGTGKQRAGKASRVLVGATALTFASWNINMSGADLDTVNFESYNVAAAQSYDEGIMGVITCGLTFGGDWDAGVNPLGATPGLYPRDDLASTTFYENRIDAVLWTFPYLRVRNVSNGATARDKVTFNVQEAKSQGPFTYPTTSV